VSDALAQLRRSSCRTLTPARTSTAAGWPSSGYLSGHKVKDIAGQLGISRTTVYKWIARFTSEGPAGLADRSSRPRTSPRQLSLGVELRVLQARLDLDVGPVQLAAELAVPASTIGAVLRRWQVPRLADLDRLTGELLRSRATDERYEHPRPGDLLHVDVKKLGRIPDGGGWRLDGALTPDHRRGKHIKTGSTTSTSPSTTTAPSPTPRSTRTRKPPPAQASCTALQIHRRFIKPGCPWTNGKAERFNRTLLTEWAYAQPWHSTTDRNTAL
jgi:hypothetical protein